MRTSPILTLLASLLFALPSAGCRNEAKTVTDVDGDGFSDETDCDDNDAAVGEGETWYGDNDVDGYGAIELATTACVAPEGYQSRSDDCNDADASIHPDAEEICDGIDQDCDGVVDNGADATAWYTDGDADGYGDDATEVYDCAQPPGTVPVPGDCDDTDPAYNPSADESDCSDPNDYNCDGSVGFVDTDGDGFAACAECDDGDPAINPSAVEVCNGGDDDCDGLADDADDSVDTSTGIVVYADVDGDGFGDVLSPANVCEAGAGWVTDATDCDDGRPDVNPAANEICDALDDDCDGLVDDADDSLDLSTGTTSYTDGDSDGFGDDATVTLSCEPAAGSSALGGDCDDANPAYNPGASEPDCTDPNDYNCDGSVGYADADADGFAACAECDDTNSDNHPGAAEYCDSVDNDCDSLVDEDDAVDQANWYADADTDSFGDAATVTLACNQPAGFVPDDTDCDDTNAAISPAQVELCNDLDDDCDGTIDEDSARDAASWYGDTDNDGYGDFGSDTVSCAAPSGYVDNHTDCDDTNRAVNPSAIEVCNTIDDDCDSVIDESDAADATTWYADADSDTHGDPDATLIECVQPSGYVLSADDCNDADPAISPDATEICNSLDDDCNSLVDDGAGPTWYADADSDTYGDPSSSTVACTPSGSDVADYTDCDDTNPDVHPGATERTDGVDEDCDGSVDDGGWHGTGADGPLTVSGTTTLGAASVVTAISGATLTVSGTPVVSVGDEILVLNMHGSDAAHTHVGTYAFLWVAGVSGSDVTVESAPSVVFGESTNSDLSGQAVQMVRVPQYTDVQVLAGGVLTAPVWDGATGGVLAFRANGTVVVDVGGLITVDEAGYAAGNTGTAYNNDGYQGESYAGAGDGNLDSSYSGYYGNWAYGYYQANYGGGGAMITGGGGNYAGGATAGASWDGGNYPPAAAGDTYGSADLGLLFPGSGGAGVWDGYSSPGPGGDGAGILYVGAAGIDASGAASISAMGGSTLAWATGSWTYGAGGGAGGSVWLVADDLSLGSGAVDATGGFGEATHIRVGGDGGDGRIRLDFMRINGYDLGGTEAISAVSAGSEPDAGDTEAI